MDGWMDVTDEVVSFTAVTVETAPGIKKGECYSLLS